MQHLCESPKKPYQEIKKKTRKYYNLYTIIFFENINLFKIYLLKFKNPYNKEEKC